MSEGLTIERFALVSFPINSGLLGLGKARSGFIVVAILVALVLACHAPTLRFFTYDANQVWTVQLNGKIPFMYIHNLSY